LKRLVALAALALGVAACGSAGTGSPSGTSPSAALTTPGAKPTPVVVVFKLNGIGTTAKGTIGVSAQGSSLTVELKITGLQAKSSHVSHIHVGNCQARGSIKFALNQVVADGQGVADTKTTLNATYPPTGATWYVVVHAGPDMQGTNSQYLLCGNLFK
jgi:CHRD domain